MKFFIASFNRASDGALSKLTRRLKEEGMWTDDYRMAEYIIAPGDRIETLHFVIDRFNENKKVIHLWAGEQSQGTHDETWRGFITEMSMMQLCTNEAARDNLSDKTNAYVIGNLMLDDLVVDESLVPKGDYDVVLYNPPTVLSMEKIQAEIKSIFKRICEHMSSGGYFWIEPNGDEGSELIYPYVNCETLPRSQFLGLVKNCREFITNSSCMFYEAQFLLKKDQIIPVGIRNSNRESKYSDMSQMGATEEVIRLLKGL